MAKFYVQSGSFRGIVDSYDEESAAVWAIHRVMGYRGADSRDIDRSGVDRSGVDRSGVDRSGVDRSALGQSASKLLSSEQTRSASRPSDANTPETATPFDPLIDSVDDGNSQIENELREQADVGLFRLGDSIGMSERGFHRKDRTKIPTKEAFLKWIQLMHAINALQDHMDQAFSDW
ncbi:MAG: hypothetical protein FJ308_07480 [Planctomycetes bacterium]|nr:hypothetical protein [Planctomycetota bacterium]